MEKAKKDTEQTQRSESQANISTRRKPRDRPIPSVRTITQHPPRDRGPKPSWRTSTQYTPRDRGYPPREMTSTQHPPRDLRLMHILRTITQHPPRDLRPLHSLRTITQHPPRDREPMPSISPREGRGDGHSAGHGDVRTDHQELSHELDDDHYVPSFGLRRHQRNDS